MVDERMGLEPDLAAVTQDNECRNIDLPFKFGWADDCVNKWNSGRLLFYPDMHLKLSVCVISNNSYLSSTFISNCGLMYGKTC